MKMTGGDAILRSLEAEGVDIMFGIPGGRFLGLAIWGLSLGVTAVMRRGTILPRSETKRCSSLTSL